MTINKIIYHPQSDDLKKLCVGDKIHLRNGSEYIVHGISIVEHILALSSYFQFNPKLEFILVYDLESNDKEPHPKDILTIIKKDDNII